MSAYFILLDGTQAGPFTMEELRVRWGRGELDKSSFYWREGMPEWKPFGDTMQKVFEQQQRTNEANEMPKRLVQIGGILAAAVIVVVVVYFITNKPSTSPSMGVVSEMPFDLKTKAMSVLNEKILPPKTYQILETSKPWLSLSDSYGITIKYRVSDNAGHSKDHCRNFLFSASGDFVGAPESDGQALLK